MLVNNLLFFYLIFFGLLLFVKWKGVNLFLSVPRAIFFANYFYFFVIFYIFNYKNMTNLYYNALIVVVIYLTGFLLGEFINFKKELKVNIIDYYPSSLLVLYIYILVMSILIINKWQLYGNPIEGFTKSYLSNTYLSLNEKKGSYIYSYFFEILSYFLYISSLYSVIYFNLKKYKKFFLYICIVLLFLVYKSYDGSKSSLIMPIYYFIVLIFIKTKSLDDLKKFNFSFKQLLVIVVVAIMIGYLLVYLNEVRSEHYSSNFLKSFLARIDFFPTLEGYLQNYTNFNYLNPLSVFFINFIPSKIAEIFSIYKPLINFDVYYTQFAYQNFSRLSSSASVGIGTWIELFKPLFGEYSIYFSPFILGFITSKLIKISHYLLLHEKKGILLFISIVPALHIISFFELTNNLIFKLIIFYFISLLLSFIFFIFKLGTLYINKIKG